MRFTRDFLSLTLADFIVRSAYQMGKTPLLPVFAATLGATDAFLGMIVSVSTVTGLLLKPLIGLLSDQRGRRLWLIIGTLFFGGIPFLYQFVQSPEQLFLIRMIHGMATAIYGPVTLAYIAELIPEHVAEGLGWFGLARSGGYIVGPALAGWLLLSLNPVDVFTLIGVISLLAFVPVLSLHEPEHPPRKRQPDQTGLFQESLAAIRACSRTPSIWLSGILEATTFIALYTVKAFLPVFALNTGMSVALVGLFFSVQEAVYMLLKPAGGRMGDRLGYIPAIIGGMVLLAIGLVLVPLNSGPALLLPAILTGLAQALIFPATVALVSYQIPRENIGAGMGFIGMWQNAGKVAGPVIGGLLIQSLDFQPVLNLLAILLIGIALALPTVMQTRRLHTDSR